MPLTNDGNPGKVIAAKRCNDNATVYLAPGGSWNEDRSYARIVTNWEDQQRLLRIAQADAENHLISHPYLTDEFRAVES